jgi:hypothetical protein
VATNDSGNFQVAVGAGTYTVTGTSRMYNGGDGTCRAEQPVKVTSQDVSGIVVACSIK